MSVCRTTIRSKASDLCGDGGTIPWNVRGADEEADVTAPGVLSSGEND
jgi:hypothetical protein